MSTITTDFNSLKKMAKEFFDAVHSLNRDELENAFKAFGLAYIGCEYPDDFMGNIDREANAPALFRIVQREYLARIIDLEDDEYTNIE